MTPANALCILPAGVSSLAADLYLAFAEQDEQMAEVVSKALLVAEDQRIRDAALLAQIRDASGG